MARGRVDQLSGLRWAHVGYSYDIPEVYSLLASFGRGGLRSRRPNSCDRLLQGVVDWSEFRGGDGWGISGGIGFAWSPLGAAPTNTQLPVNILAGARRLKFSQVIISVHRPTVDLRSVAEFRAIWANSGGLGRNRGDVCQFCASSGQCRTISANLVRFGSTWGEYHQFGGGFDESGSGSADFRGSLERIGTISRELGQRWRCFDKHRPCLAKLPWLGARYVSDYSFHRSNLGSPGSG